MNNCLVDYFRCPEKYSRLALTGDVPAGRGYFRFGVGSTCFGDYYGQRPALSAIEMLRDGLNDVSIEQNKAVLCFDPDEVIGNLRRESYVGREEISTSILSHLYYFVRPLLPVFVRSILQKVHLRGWEKLAFPQWPVDCSVDLLHERLLLLSLRASGADRIPFIWFWPEGKSSCALVTHDIETKVGRDFCATLMDIDDGFGIKASFQVVPEERYTVSEEFLDSIRQRGFEVVVHDLNHDGRLFKDYKQFLERAANINSYVRKFRATGFRAGVLYRRQSWFDAFKFSYDMSVPNVAHLDPQRGGCCTVMPYFVGDILEIPVTTIQDYTLFHILHDYSINIWKQQIELIMTRHGLMSFIVHPDYVMKQSECEIYQALLEHLEMLRGQKSLWITVPGEVDRWWRQRAQMRVVEKQGSWCIEGVGSERARLAWASEVDGQLVLTLEPKDESEVQPVSKASQFSCRS
jgi:hypothetical protein